MLLATRWSHHAGKRQRWYVSRISIGCCAADGVAYRVHVIGRGSPPKDSWVRVTGLWVDPSQQCRPTNRTSGPAWSSRSRRHVHPVSKFSSGVQ